MVAVASHSPSRVENARQAESVLDTTELRWFAPGPVPSDVRAWFADSTGVCEERCDAYLLNGRHDVGVKRRFRSKLELKVRQSFDGYVDLGGGLAGPLEVWRRQSPTADCADGDGGHWVDVCKSIVKRRFLHDGREVPYESGGAVDGAGCDVEIAEVSVGDAHGWTFAFEAFGPRSGRRDALFACWKSLIAEAPCPERFGYRAGRAMGYPEWLALAVTAGRRYARFERETALVG